jgi:hypothetical protein
VTDESPTERVLRRSMIDEDGGGRPFSERVRHHRRTLEAYFKAGSIPRWMERVSEVDQGIAHERRRFDERYRALKGEYGHDREEFARRWEAIAHAARFYVKVNGRSYRRPELGAAWVLEHFPAR